jgi:hypothetical protein
MEDKKLTEGEAMIGDILFHLNIKFEEQKEIHGLKNDSKSFRIADFYLPKFEVYLEFLGKWDSPEGKEEYKHKMAVYKSNNIPCIYIYPENLGAFPWIFAERLRAELLRYKKDRLLWKFEIWEFWHIAWYFYVISGLIFYITDNIWIRIFIILLIACLTIARYLEVLKRHKRIKERHSKGY